MSAWLFIPFIATLFMGIPIAFSLGISSLIFLSYLTLYLSQLFLKGFFRPSIPLRSLPFPFFILAGQLMNKTGITRSLVKFADIIIGRLRGGLAQVNILASIFFAGLTGAGVAEYISIGFYSDPSHGRARFYS